MLPLIRTLVDITLLRKGPEAIPYSWMLLYLCIGLWLAALLATVMVTRPLFDMGILPRVFDATDAWVGVGSAVVAAVCYLLVLAATSYGARAVQTLSALIGCGAIISFVMLLEIVLVAPTLGAETAYFGAFIVLVWSVPVKGHIIARAINWHWYGGIVVAFSIFLLQFAFTSSMTPEP